MPDQMMFDGVVGAEILEDRGSFDGQLMDLPMRTTRGCGCAHGNDSGGCGSGSGEPCSCGGACGCEGSGRSPSGASAAASLPVNFDGHMWAQQQDPGGVAGGGWSGPLYDEDGNPLMLEYGFVKGSGEFPVEFGDGSAWGQVADSGASVTRKVDDVRPFWSCTQRIYLHMCIDVRWQNEHAQDCTQGDLNGVVAAMGRATARFWTNAHCPCPSGQTGEGCWFSVSVVWHKDCQRKGPVLPLPLRFRCRKHPEGGFWGQDGIPPVPKGTNPFGLTQPNEWMIVYGQAGQKLQRLTMDAVYAHELGHDLLLTGVMRDGWTNDGHNVGDEQSGGLMTNRPKIGTERVTAKEACEVLKRVGGCNMDECCYQQVANVHGGDSEPLGGGIFTNPELAIHGVGAATDSLLAYDIARATLGVAESSGDYVLP